MSYGSFCHDRYGAAAIGFFSAITPAVAGLSSPVLGYCSSSSETKQPVMILGSMVRPACSFLIGSLLAGHMHSYC
eukprot:COSAG03_NODE_209_length_10610_cov_3.098088_6_plen_75_part_00